MYFKIVVNLLEEVVQPQQERLHSERIVIGRSQVDYNFSVHLLNPLKAPIFLR